MYKVLKHCHSYMYIDVHVRVVRRLVSFALYLKSLKSQCDSLQAEVVSEIQSYDGDNDSAVLD